MAGDFGDPMELERLATRPELFRWSANSSSPDEPRPSDQIEVSLPELPGLVSPRHHEQIAVRFLRRDPPPKHHSTAASNREQVAIRRSSVASAVRGP